MMKANKTILIKNQNKWIVTNLNYQKLFASNSNLRELQKKIKQLKIKDAVISYVPPFDKTLTPYVAP